jgi:hypothetical protein
MGTLAVILLTSAASIAAAQEASAPAGTLAVSGDITTPLSLTAAELKALPRTRVEVKEDNRTLTYEGVLAGEILKRAGGQGPVRIVAPRDVRGSRSVRVLTRLEIVRLRK